MTRNDLLNEINQLKSSLDGDNDRFIWENRLDLLLNSQISFDEAMEELFFSSLKNALIVFEGEMSAKGLLSIPNFRIASEHKRVMYEIIKDIIRNMDNIIDYIKEISSNIPEYSYKNLEIINVMKHSGLEINIIFPDLTEKDIYLMFIDLYKEISLDISGDYDYLQNLSQTIYQHISKIYDNPMRNGD